MLKTSELNRTVFNRYAAATIALAGVLSVSASVANAHVIVTSGEVIGRNVQPPHDHTEIRQRLGAVVCHDVDTNDQECGSAIEQVPVVVHDGATYTLTLRDCAVADYPGICVEGDVNVSQSDYENAQIGSKYLPDQTKS